MHSEDIVDRLAAEFSARYAGAMYRATLYNGAEVSRRITEWRLKRRQKKGTTTKSSGKRYGDTSFEEVALEAKRQELLKSEDAEERKQGEAMVTPTSIWLADQDPKAFRSARLALLGESKDKQSADRETKTCGRRGPRSRKGPTKRRCSQEEGAVSPRPREEHNSSMDPAQLSTCSTERWVGRIPSPGIQVLLLLT